MFVAHSPFSFLCVVLFITLAYTTRTGLLLTGLRHCCGGGLLYHQIYLPGDFTDALWGVSSPAIADSRVNYWGYRLRYRRGSGYGDVKVPCCLRGVALLGKHCRYWFSLPAMLACGGVLASHTGEEINRH